MAANPAASPFAVYRLMALVLSWNVAGRVTCLDEQIERVLGFGCDVACLQEVTPRTAPRWSEALEAPGYAVEPGGWPVEPRGLRRLTVLTAARAGLRRPPGPPLPWPERHLACAVFAAVTEGEDVPRVLAGDLNTPRYESREGEVLTFARTRSGRLRPAYGRRHDEAELALVVGLPARGWRDAFRALHGYERRDRSWVSRAGYGWRLDHLIVSPHLRPVACDYLHEWRERGLSDHSAIWADVIVQGRRQP